MGKAIVDWRANQVVGARRIDGCGIVMVEELGTTPNGLRKEHFGGFVLSRRCSPYGVAFGWLHKRGLNTKWFQARYVMRRLWWKWFGRPPARVMGACHEGPLPDFGPIREAAVTELRSIAKSLS